MDALFSGWKRATWAALIAGFGVRAWIAATDHGIYWPDEIHQSLEQAHRLAFGPGFVPWEFRDGARSWLLPGALAGAWRVAAALGVHSPLGLVGLARGAMVAASTASIWLAARIAERIASARAGATAALVLALLPAALGFGHRALSETASAPFVALAAWALTERPRHGAALAGVAAGVATVLRTPNGLFAIAFSIWLACARRRELSGYCLTTGAVICAGGVLDACTWGRFLHSPLVYLEFNLAQAGASRFGVEPFSYYFRSLWSSTGPVALALLLAALVGARRARALGLTLAGVVLVHCLIPHKELRFLVPCLPIGAALVGIGAEPAWQRLTAPTQALAAVAFALAMGWKALHLSFGELGQFAGTARATQRIWHANEDVTLLLAEAGQRPDLCGLVVSGAAPAFTGGYTYLHRAVPLTYGSGRCAISDAVNYAIVPLTAAPALLPAGYTLAAPRGGYGLYRRAGSCASGAATYEPPLEGASDLGLRRPIAEQSEYGSVHFRLLEDSASFARGWSTGESVDCRPGRWAVETRATVRFILREIAGRYSLRVLLQAPASDVRQHVQLSLNGLPLAGSDVASTPSLLEAEVPGSALHGGTNELGFEFSSVSPAGAGDPRQLAALLRFVELRPAEPLPARPVPAVSP